MKAPALQVASIAYPASQLGTPARRIRNWLLVAVAHAAALTSVLLLERGRTVPVTPERTMLVSLVTDPQPAPPQEQMQPPTPVPPPPILPKPVQELVSTPQVTSSPIVTPPPEEVATEAPPSVPPPSPVASTAASEDAVIVSPDFTADYLNNPGPKYPEASRRRREEGVVLLKVLVSETGNPEQVLIDRSSGYSN